MQSPESPFPLSGLTPDKKAQIVEFVFAEAEPALDALVSELKEGIADRKWDTFLSDDTSARLPSLVIWNIARRVAAENNQMPPKQLFFPGGRAIRNLNLQRELQENFKDLAQKSPGRVLVITEYAASGVTLETTSQLLKKARVPHDIAVLVDAFGDMDKKLKDKLPKGTQLYIGKRKSGFAFIGSDIIGVKKVGTYMGTGFVERDWEADRESVEISRAKAKELADRLYENHFRKVEVEKAA